MGTTVGEDHRDLCRHLCHHTISVSGQGKEGLIGRIEGEGEGKEEWDEEEKERGVEVMGGGSPQPDSRRQNVSSSQRGSM